MSIVRNAWRQLTSMRTALVLLFLLALAAIPGSVFPQRTLGPEKVNEYFREHPDLAPWLDRFQFFGVYSSVWFSAIYLLLFTSLVGCLVPRLRTHIGALVRVPPDAPSRLDRLPAHAGGIAHDGDPAATAQRLRRLLRSRRFRAVVRPADLGWTVSGEKGYLKETGNLLFHFSLLGLLVGVAAGASFGWHGNRIVVAGEEHGFCNSIQQYDEFGRGGRVDAADLPRFCVSLVDFKASYLDSGQPVSYDAVLRRESGASVHEQRVRVNHPLRMPGATVYVLGHGYAPVVRYTDRAGRAQTTVAPFLPIDGALTSTGLAAFPDANVGASGSGPKQQVAFSGAYLPTAPGSGAHDVSSAFPAERDPLLVVQPYLGDLGLDAGIPQSVYEINQGQVRNGRLSEFGPRLSLRPGQTSALPDGSRVEFLGTRQWVSVSVRYDPGERFVLVGAVLLVFGLLGSLMGRRRRVFFRVTDDGVSAGGLPRGDYPGFAAEFESIVRDARGKGHSDDGGAIGPASRGDDSGVSGGDAVLRG
jgi:cytochrome c biogenesis protein